MTQLLRSVWALILDIVGAVIGVIAVVEDFLHHQLLALGVQEPIQSLIMIAVAVVLALIAFRALRGLLRLLLVLFLILFLVHVALPLLQH